MICVSVMLAIYLAWPLAFGGHGNKGLETAAVAEVVKPQPKPRFVPDAVVVGFDLTLTYARVCRASWWIQQGKLFVATNPDRVCPTDQPTVLVDCAAICAMIEKATGRAPDIVLGKD